MTDTHPAAAPATAQPLARYTTAETGEAYWFFDSLMVIRADQPGQPVIIEATVAPGGGAPLHVHADLDDSFYLVAGRTHGRLPEDQYDQLVIASTPPNCVAGSAGACRPAP